MTTLRQRIGDLGRLPQLLWRKPGKAGSAGSQVLPVHAEIEQFVSFLGFLHLRGRIIHASQPVKKVAFRVAGTVMSETVPNEENRFEFRMRLGDADFVMRSPTLLVTYADGTSLGIEHPSQFLAFDGLGLALYGRFLNRLATMSPGEVLEIGSRARSGVVRRSDIPPGWRYTGFDIMPGENVDVCGDAHNLSAVLPTGYFQAVMSLAVFEHLLMPWKVVVEMNRIMAPGALGFAFTHQTFPLHDEPCDYFRFSTWSWPALFNEMTGFRIIEVGAAEPVYVVAQRWSQGVDHGTFPGMTVSSVLFEKTGDTDLAWPVDPHTIVQAVYPA